MDGLPSGSYLSLNDGTSVVAGAEPPDVGAFGGVGRKA